MKNIYESPKFEFVSLISESNVADKGMSGDWDNAWDPDGGGDQ